MSGLIDGLIIALYLQIPIVFGGVWHMVAVKRHWAINDVAITRSWVGSKIV